MVNIRKNYLNGTPKTKTELYNGKKIIIIHNTATPGATTKNEDEYFHREWARLQTFVHAFVDWTGDAVEYQPAGCIAWGAGNVNKYAWLQVEQCIGTDEQNRQSAEYVAQYVAEKIKASGEPFESFAILSHAEASLKFGGSDHMDSIVGVGLPDFINRVKDLTKSKVAAKVETTSTGSTGVFTCYYPIKARQDGPDTTNKHVYTFDTGDRITFDRKLSANGYEWISQPRSGGGFWYIPIRELKNPTYWGEIEKR